MSKSKKYSKRVAILIEDPVALFELGCAVELFALARPGIKGWYQAEVVSLSGTHLNATGGIKISASKINDLDGYDMLVVPSWPIDLEAPKQILLAVNRLHERGGTLLSFCSGVFFLAQTGLLNGGNATTHWLYSTAFKKRFKQIRYVDDVLYLYKNGIGCSAGSSAAIDLGIEVIRKDFGYKIANQVARRLVLAAHRSGGQSQFVEAPVPKNADRFSVALDWALGNLTSRIDVSDLAKKANMTRRTFDRQFRKTLNMSPKEWIIQQRLLQAKQLLETTELNIDVVASNSGFETAVSLRHNFRKHFQLSPSQFRQQFSSLS